MRVAGAVVVFLLRVAAAAPGVPTWESIIQERPTGNAYKLAEMLFASVDTDDDGAITKSEVRDSLMEQEGLSSTSEELAGKLKNLWELLNTDDDEEVDEREMEMFVLKLHEVNGELAENKPPGKPRGKSPKAKRKPKAKPKAARDDEL